MTTQPRRARKVDANQAPIVSGLRALSRPDDPIGVMVLNAEFDFMVGYRLRNFAFECKKDHRPSRLKKSQEKLRTTWPGQYSIVSTLDEALAVMGWMEEKRHAG